MTRRLGGQFKHNKLHKPNQLWVCTRADSKCSHPFLLFISFWRTQVKEGGSYISLQVMVNSRKSYSVWLLCKPLKACSILMLGSPTFQINGGHELILPSNLSGYVFNCAWNKFLCGTEDSILLGYQPSTLFKYRSQI